MNLVNRKTREIIGQYIDRYRFLQRIQNLVDNAPKAEFYFSDAFPVYSQICYKGIYRALNNRSRIFIIESVNADLRQYISFLHCKFRYCFCSFDTIIAVFKSLLSINFLWSNFVLIILNIIYLILLFYFNYFSQFFWSSTKNFTKIILINLKRRNRL